MWKIFENLAPSIGHGDNGGVLKLHARNGRSMSLPEVKNNIPCAIKKMRDSSLTVQSLPQARPVWGDKPRRDFR